MVRKPRKTAKQKAAEETKNPYAPQYGRVAYENFILQNGWKPGQIISDESGRKRIPLWDQHKSFVKERWHRVAQAVIDAATGKPA